MDLRGGPRSEGGVEGQPLAPTRVQDQDPHSGSHSNPRAADHFFVLVRGSATPEAFEIRYILVSVLAGLLTVTLTVNSDIAQYDPL